MKNKHIYTFLIVLLMVNIATASLFSDIRDRFIPKPLQLMPISQPDDSFKELYEELMQYNTQQNINILMAYTNHKTVKIHISDMNRDIYISHSGLSQSQIITDKSISLSSYQIRNILGFIADNKISWYEQLQILTMI